MVIVFGNCLGIECFLLSFLVWVVGEVGGYGCVGCGGVGLWVFGVGVW